MFCDLLASCMLIIIVFHTCTDPLNTFAERYCLSIGQKYVEFSRMIHWSTGNTFWSTNIVHESCTRTQTPTMNLISHTPNFGRNDVKFWWMIYWSTGNVSDLHALCMLIFILVPTCTDTLKPISKSAANLLDCRLRVPYVRKSYKYRSFW